MPILEIDKITIKEDSLEYPFDDIYRQYEFAKGQEFEAPMRFFFKMLKGVWEKKRKEARRLTKRQTGRNLIATSLVSKNKKLPEVLEGKIGSFISGKDENLSIKEQLALLANNYRYNSNNNNNNSSGGGTRKKSKMR